MASLNNAVCQHGLGIPGLQAQDASVWELRGASEAVLSSAAGLIIMLPGGWEESRLMCSGDTTPEDVDGFAADLGELATTTTAPR